MTGPYEVVAIYDQKDDPKNHLVVFQAANGRRLWIEFRDEDGSIAQIRAAMQGGRG